MLPLTKTVTHSATMATTTNDSISPAPDFSLYDLEFRSTVDEAWYSVRVVLEDATLVVKFWGFDDRSDEKFTAEGFQTVEAVDEFFQRFRPYSEQVQDEECRDVKEGSVLCAALTAADGSSTRFFDATVHSVNHVKHRRAKNGEECLCTFAVRWLNGPDVGQLNYTSIANLCHVTSFKVIDTRVASFVKMAKGKLENVSQVLYDSGSSDNASFGKDGVADKEQNSMSQQLVQVMEEIRECNSLALVNPEAGSISNVRKRKLEDADIGGESRLEVTGSHYFILIDYVEKNLSPTSITEFIHQQTAISPQALVYPSSASESYMRGAVVMDSKEKFRVIYGFLSNPDHMIVSSTTGRPWVIIGAPSRCGLLRETIGSAVLIPEERMIDDELRVVQKGSKEFEAAKKEKKLYMQFVQHQQRMHTSLESQRSAVHLDT